MTCRTGDKEWRSEFVFDDSRFIDTQIDANPYI